MFGMLLVPKVICMSCGHVPVGEPYPANREAHVERRLLMRCLNVGCPQYKILFAVPLHELGAEWLKE